MSKTTQQKQIDRFQRTARELECDESDVALERVFKKIDPKKRPETAKKPTKQPGLPTIGE